MISFFVRSLIICIGIFAASFLAVISDASLGAIIFFLCIWVSVRSFSELFWWILFVSFFYSFMHYDVLGVYFLVIVGTVYVFDFLKVWIVRSRRGNIWVYYFLMITLILFASLIAGLFYHDHMYFDFEKIIHVFVLSTIVFFVMRWIIERFERYVELYTRGSDLKCHT